MASLSGWTFVIIGGVVAVWSYFQESLLFFSIVGAVMVLYGIGKIIYARALAKSQTPANKPVPSGQQREMSHAQMNAYRAMQAQRLLQQNAQPQQHPGTHMHATHARAHQAPTHVAGTHAHHVQQPHVAQATGHNAHLSQPHTAYKICPNCKKHMHVTYRFCPHCGWGV